MLRIKTIRYYFYEVLKSKFIELQSVFEFFFLLKYKWFMVNSWKLNIVSPLRFFKLRSKNLKISGIILFMVKSVTCKHCKKNLRTPYVSFFVSLQKLHKIKIL